MPKFYCLYNSKSDSADTVERITALQNACNTFNIEFILIDEKNVDFSKLPIPTSQDGLFNSTRGSMLLERIMLNQQVKTFYKNNNSLVVTDVSNYWSIIHEKENIAAPKTIFKGSNDKKLLKSYVDYLGAFPVILKTYGGTGGVGVMKVSTWETLYSITDYLVANSADFVMKEFIPSPTCERLTVVGDHVVAGVSRPNKTDDFRSDGFSREVIPTTYSNEINQLAINDVHSCNMNLGGVDIIIDERTNIAYVLEINMPLNFIISQIPTGINIAEKMIAWLFKIK